jgi:hypothetical protein
MQVNSKLFGQLQRNFQQQIAALNNPQAPQGQNGQAPPQQPAMAQ